MNYADEPYIKVYTRDTATYRALDWRARGLLLELARRVDRSGILEVGKAGLKGIAVLIGGAFDEMRPFIEELIGAEKLLFRPELGQVVLLDHVEMQGTPQSDAARARRLRTHRRDVAVGASRSVTDRHEESLDVAQESASPDVTDRHEENSPQFDGPPSRAVTRRHAPSRSLNRSDQIRTPPTPPGGGVVSAVTRIGPAEEPPGEPETSARLNTAAMGDGCFGMTGEAWREGVAISTKRTVTRLSPRETADLNRLVDAHAEGRQGERLLAWVRDMARDYADHELTATGGKFGITPSRAAKWIDAGTPAPESGDDRRRRAS